MNSSPKEILRLIEENDIKFIRLTFCDIFGNLKNIAIMPTELDRAFSYGIPVDYSEFDESSPELVLFPDISTLSVLPWRPKSGRVIRFFCSLRNNDGTPYASGMRTHLTEYINELRQNGYSCEISTRCEFYLFNLDENGKPTKIPHDRGGYLDVAPLDKCENTRREICLALEEMGFNPKSSCHKHGSGQNEIAFRANKTVDAADDMVHYKSIVKSVAEQCGLFASFMPRPLENEHGSALTLSFIVEKNGEHIFDTSPDNITEEGKCFISGILRRMGEITVFLNPTVNSYSRFGVGYAPKYINFSIDDRTSLIRLCSYNGLSPRIEFRSADAACNPYIAFKLLIAAGIEGIKNGDSSLYYKGMDNSQELPDSLEKALNLARDSQFVRDNLPENVRKLTFRHICSQLEALKEYDSTEQFCDEYYFPYI